VGDALGVGYALQTLGLVAMQGGQLRQASRSFVDALIIRRNLGDRRGMIECVEGIASVAGLSDRPADAARLFGAAQFQRERIAAPLPEPEIVHYAPILEGIKRRLGDDAFVSQVEAGRALELEDAVAQATTLGLELAATPASATTPLSARELEVVRLIAAGLTNAQAADQLFLSRRTVDAHMRRIYDKLRLGSRSDVVRFALEQGLV
jgi:DNA-binding CsgD family transcriptional regulator